MRAVAVSAALILLAAGAGGEERDELSTDAQRLGYSIGYQVGGDLRRDGMPVDIDLVVEGVLSALEGAEPRLSVEEMRESLTGMRRASEAARRERSDDPEAP